MDDVVSSVAEVQEAFELYQQWVGLFRAGGFRLVKWATNSAELLQLIPQDARRGGMVEFPTDVLTVLGLCWRPEQDELAFRVDVRILPGSKRSALSTMARIWDPLGLLVPVTVTVKLLMKTLWGLRLDWNDLLPPEISEVWAFFLTELLDLSNFKISRFLGVRPRSRIMLVGFCDASEKAYAAAIYMVMDDDGYPRRSRLLCAKSKVAPTKPFSIPRLELCGALLLSRLLSTVLKIYQGVLTVQATYGFTDSTVVLHWLQGAPHRWKTFVANRVAKIQETLPQTQWRHVRGEENPADCASRGLSPNRFLTHRLWLEGPGWLIKPPDGWP